MKRILLAMLLLPLTMFADGGLPNQPFIYVEGTAEVEQAADMVTLQFKLTALDPEQSEANKIVQAKAARIFKLLKSLEVADTDIVASDLESEPQYEELENSRTRGKLKGYQVTRPFTVKVRAVAKFPQLVDDLLALKGLEFSGIREGLTNAKELEDQVWAKAVANARERADKTLKSSEMKVDSVFAISPVAFPQIHPKIFGSPNEWGGPDPVALGPGPVNASQYHLAPVSVSQSIHVIYLISPVK